MGQFFFFTHQLGNVCFFTHEVIDFLKLKKNSMPAPRKSNGAPHALTDLPSQQVPIAFPHTRIPM